MGSITAIVVATMVATILAGLKKMEISIIAPQITNTYPENRWVWFQLSSLSSVQGTLMPTV